MYACVMFGYKGKDRTTGGQSQDVNATVDIERNASLWCNYASSHVLCAFDMSLQLPRGVFLICDDCACVGIPKIVRGGPCSLGRLTLLTPNIIMMHQKSRSKPSLRHNFTSQCRDEVAFGGRGSIASASIFAPGVASAHALSSLNKLGCWLAKQSNDTSVALSGLLLDVNSIRHATLQNRAAIDFLLLSHSHGCQDFEGMCYMNLSDHSESIYKSIANLKKRVNHLQVDGEG